MEKSVSEAIEDVLGPAQASMLISLVMSQKTERARLAKMPPAQQTLLWLRENMPVTADKVLQGDALTMKATPRMENGPKENEDQVRLQATIELVDAAFSAASKLGIQGLFRKLLVAELPDNPWLKEIEINDEDAGNIFVKARHLCTPRCPINLRECITALKIEDMICKKKSEPYSIASVRPAGTRVKVLLRRFTPLLLRSIAKTRRVLFALPNRFYPAPSTPAPPISSTTVPTYRLDSPIIKNL